MKQKILMLIFACLLLAGCGRAKPTTEPEARESIPVPELTVRATPAAEQTPEPELIAPNENASMYMGTWIDDAHPELSLVFDDKCAGALSQTAPDGTVTVWTFSGAYDSETGAITYEDCVKQINAPDGTVTTVYTDGRGSFTSLDGYLYWNDDVENAGARVSFRMAI